MLQSHIKENILEFLNYSSWTADSESSPLALEPVLLYVSSLKTISASDRGY